MMERMKCRWSKDLRAILLLAATLAGAIARAQPVQETASGTPAPKVVEVRVVSNAGAVLLEQPAGLAVKVGEPLQPVQVAASLRTLYQSGNYADLRAVTYPQGDGVRLDFIAKENLYFSQILIRGLKPPPTEASAVASMQLSLGQTYREQDVKDAAERLRETLRDEGLYQAKISIEERPRVETHQVDIAVNLDSGPRVRVKNIQIINNTEYLDAEILARFKLRSGRELTNGRVQSGLQRIRKFLEKTGYLSAGVSARRGEYDSAANSIPLVLEVNEGPRVKLAVAGAKISQRDLKKLVPVYQEGSVDADLLEEGRRNLRERLERAGYFDAKVDYAVAAHEVAGSKAGWKGTEEIITFTVEKGTRHELS